MEEGKAGEGRPRRPFLNTATILSAGRSVSRVGIDHDGEAEGRSRAAEAGQTQPTNEMGVALLGAAVAAAPLWWTAFAHSEMSSLACQPTLPHY